jgi:cell fate regulator YaaT (PSP1 superfamily)
MKLADAEFTFDNNKVIFLLYGGRQGGFPRAGARLASVFKKRIELRQIGIRDQSKMLGGLGPCGKPCCCSQHLPDFKHVSIKWQRFSCFR